MVVKLISRGQNCYICPLILQPLYVVMLLMRGYYITRLTQQKFNELHCDTIDTLSFRQKFCPINLYLKWGKDFAPIPLRQQNKNEIRYTYLQFCILQHKISNSNKSHFFHSKTVTNNGMNILLFFGLHLLMLEQFPKKPQCSGI